MKVVLYIIDGGDRVTTCVNQAQGYAQAIAKWNDRTVRIETVEMEVPEQRTPFKTVLPKRTRAFSLSRISHDDSR